jgi:hypothetical protein
MPIAESRKHYYCGAPAFFPEEAGAEIEAPPPEEVGAAAPLVGEVDASLLAFEAPAPAAGASWVDAATAGLFSAGLEPAEGRL